jgi:cohesin loading factor subunit SCC2
MTLERSAAIMDSIFASSEDEGHGRVLKILQEFLVSEATKHSALEKGMQSAFSRTNLIALAPSKYQRSVKHIPRT